MWWVWSGFWSETGPNYSEVWPTEQQALTDAKRMSQNAQRWVEVVYPDGETVII